MEASNAAYGREEVNHDAALVLAALDLGLQAWRTTPSRTRFTEALAALGRLRVAAENQRTGRIAHGDLIGDPNFDPKGDDELSV